MNAPLSLSLSLFLIKYASRKHMTVGSANKMTECYSLSKPKFFFDNFIVDVLGHLSQGLEGGELNEGGQDDGTRQ